MPFPIPMARVEMEMRVVIAKLRASGAFSFLSELAPHQLNYVVLRIPNPHPEAFTDPFATAPTNAVTHVEGPYQCVSLFLS
jgi:hypothetical protein